MTTSELVTQISNAKRRADMVPVIADHLPPGSKGIDWTQVNAAMCARWSKSGRTWILERAWKVVERAAGI